MLSAAYWRKNWVRNRHLMWKIFKNQKSSLCLFVQHSFGTGMYFDFNNYSGSSNVRVCAAHSNHQWLRRQRNIYSSASPLSILNYISAIVFLTNHHSEIDRYHFFNCQRSPWRFLKGFLFCGNSFKWNKLKLQRRRLHLTEVCRVQWTEMYSFILRTL